jgi:hypothetical protein
VSARKHAVATSVDDAGLELAFHGILSTDSGRLSLTAELGRRMPFYNQTGQKQRTLWWLLVAAITLVCLLSLALAFFAPASFDDFCRGRWSRDIGTVFARVQDSYANWTGRWAGQALYALTFPHIGVTSINYDLLIALSAPLWFAVFYCFLHIFFRSSLGGKDKAIFAALLTAIYWVGMPVSGETWYWLTGSVEYQLPFLLMALSLLVLTSARVTSAAIAPKVGAVLLGALLAFLVTGLNELVGLLLLGCLFVAAFLAFVRKRLDVVAIYGIVIVVVVGGIALNITAPGNAIRVASDFPDANNPKFAVRFLVDPDTSPIRWLGDARLLCLGALLVTSTRFLKLRQDWTGWKLPLPGPLSSMAVVAPLIGLIAVVALTFAVAFAQGTEPPGRVTNLIYAALIIGWVGALAPIGRLAGADSETPGPIMRGINIGAAILLPVTLLIAPVTLKAAADLPAIATQWRPQLEARQQEIMKRAAAGERDLALSPITVDPKSYFWDDIGPVPEDWRNQCMAEFYGAKTLRTSAPQQPAR